MSRRTPFQALQTWTLAGKWNLLHDVLPDELASGLDFPVVDGNTIQHRRRKRASPAEGFPLRALLRVSLQAARFKTLL